jgi:hypothetical protein
VGIIHMNGRIYDPALARFLQADPIVQDPTSSRSLNRYSYVWNNPLNATDPSGYKKIELTPEQESRTWAADVSAAFRSQRMEVSADNMLMDSSSLSTTAYSFSTGVAMALDFVAGEVEDIRRGKNAVFLTGAGIIWFSRTGLLKVTIFWVVILQTPWQ